MKRQIEILAPAGSYESMRAAMNAGCDAVYIGGSSFGARAYANNLDEDTLLRAIDEAHIRGKQLYLTVNTLIKEQERVEKLYNYLEKLYLEGLDAVIVQDVGVMHFVHKHFPGLPIHASTQTTITMAQGAELLQDTGVTRMVTARELSLKEIKSIRENTNLEIETFVHGALCYCYSGQCLMSSMIGGRSGNRGRCAQPCRMPYKFYSGDRKLSSEKERYLISPKDINTVALIPEFVEAGIDSFKIEGRMKRPEYAAGVSYVYRKYVDLYFELGKDRYDEYIRSKAFEKDMRDLQDLYNRGGFSEGYGKTYHGKEMMSLYRPNHSGVYVGEVTSIKGSQVGITLKEDLNAQDILEIRYEEEEDGHEFTVKDPIKKGEVLRTNVGKLPTERDKSKFSKQRISLGASVYRTKNNELLKQLTADYLDKDQRQGIRGSLKAKLGERLMLTLSYKDITVKAYQETVESALKQPMTREKLAAPIEKLGDTPYYFEALEIEADDAIFVPVAWLNEIRREAVQLLQEAVTDAYRRSFEAVNETESEKKHVELGEETEAGKETHGVGEETEVKKETYDIKKAMEPGNERSKDGFVVSVRTLEQFQTALAFSEITSIYVDYEGFALKELLTMAKSSGGAGKKFYLMLPHICRLSEYEKLKKDIGSLWEDKNITGFVVKNFEEIALLESFQKEAEQKEIILNYNMYVFNKDAKEFWRERGYHHFTAPVELNARELKTLGVTDCDFIVYGYLPLMVSAQCLYESTDGCSRCKTGEQRLDYMVDRLGKKFFIQTNCNGCYNIIYNGQCLSLLKYAAEVNSLEPRNLRLDFTMEAKEEMKAVIAAFIDTYQLGRSVKFELNNLTTGHFKRGVE